ncbi:MAG: preprotein translocase subunit SecY [bacterium]
MVVEKLIQIWKAKEVRNSILFILLMLVVFRLAAHVPIPGVDVTALKDFFSSNQALGLLNLFSGGGMQNFSIVMMGVAPYITSSIVFQLLAMVVPKLEEMNKEEQGRQRINTWTRWLTIPLSALQSYSMIVLLQRSTTGILSDLSTFDMIAIITTITAGTIFLMWLGELITEKHLGNGISLMIFAGIVSGLPSALQQIAATYDPSMLLTMLSFVVVGIITVIGVVVINEGQRNIPVQYARQIRGQRSFGGTTSNLPLRVNMAGVMPIIFAISVITFPTMIAQFMAQAKSQFLANAAQWLVGIIQNQLVYGLLYFVLVFAFTYFYTEVIFHPKQIAENLQKQGAFIPGIRPGSHTEQYLSATTYKILFVGALFLGLIAVLPLIVRYFSGMQSLVIGGTSLLIVVSVVIEIVKQTQAQLSMRQYDNL